jgi:hypothetical protein
MTVEEILKATGFTDEQITTLDAKAKEAFGTVLTTAAAEREAAELAHRANKDLYDKEIAPALNDWGNESAKLKAEAAFYRTQAEEAKKAGFIAADVPGYVAPSADGTRGPDGKFVANANAVPGSPELITRIRDSAAIAVGSMLDLNHRHMQLFGTPMPDAPTSIIKEANAAHMDPVAYAAKKYDFAKKESDIRTAEQEKIVEARVKERTDAIEKKYAEQASNPNLRKGAESNFADLGKAVKAGTRPDPTKMSEADRDASTRARIMEEVRTPVQ